MRFNIYKENSSDKVAWLCDDIWDLSSQIHELEKWLHDNSKSITKDKYVIDIGFDIQPDLKGDGAAISSETMKIMAENNMDLFLSEYPNQINE